MKDALILFCVGVGLPVTLATVLWYGFPALMRAVGAL